MYMFAAVGLAGSVPYVLTFDDATGRAPPLWAFLALSLLSGKVGLGLIVFTVYKPSLN